MVSEGESPGGWSKSRKLRAHQLNCKAPSRKQTGNGRSLSTSKPTHSDALPLARPHLLNCQTTLPTGDQMFKCLQAMGSISLKHYIVLRSQESTEAIKDLKESHKDNKRGTGHWKLRYFESFLRDEENHRRVMRKGRQEGHQKGLLLLLRNSG